MQGSPIFQYPVGAQSDGYVSGRKDHVKGFPGAIHRIMFYNRAETYSIAIEIINRPLPEAKVDICFCNDLCNE